MQLQRIARARMLSHMAEHNIRKQKHYSKMIDMHTEIKISGLNPTGKNGRLSKTIPIPAYRQKHRNSAPM